ncbi:MAG TPA: mechanosensitive ion channel [Anaerolineae bacterium]|nr:mechanosensitive ion channel [Anaerolineae bacterium]
MNKLIDAILAAIGQPLTADNRTQHLATELALWLAVLLLAEYLPRILRRWVLRSRFELDDLLLAVMRAPLRVVIVFAALVNLLESLQLNSPWNAASLAARGLSAAVVVGRAGLVISLVWLLQRALEQAVVRVLANAATRTDNRMDEMLVPIVRTLVRPALYTLAIVAFMEITGTPTRAIAIAVGGGYLFLSLGAKSALDDVFGGISLLLDAPFGRGDLLLLEDGTQAKVDHLGLRVTKLYDPVEHTDISMPNRILAGQKLVNLSRPTPDKRLKLLARVEANSPDEIVRWRLKEAAYGHPWVLGRPDRKLPAMRRRIDRLVWQGELLEALEMVKELARVEAEGTLDAVIQRHAPQLFAMAARVHGLETGGFDVVEGAEVEVALGSLNQLAAGVEEAMTRWLLLVRYTYTRGSELQLDDEEEVGLRKAVAAVRTAGMLASTDDMQAVRTLTDAALAPAFARAQAYGRLVEEGLASTEAPLVRAGREERAQLYYAMEAQERWLAERGFGAPLGSRKPGGFGDLDAVEEYLGLFADWSDRVRLLRNTVDAIGAAYRSGAGRLMDEDLLALRRLLAREMHEAGPEWKEPGVSLVDSDLGLEYELKVYVDNVKLSHFARASKTGKQLRLEVMHLLRDVEPAVRLGRPIMLLDPAGLVERSGDSVRVARGN